jgi:two-component system OmpR family response regulator
MSRILVVDDDPGIRDLVSEFLGRHGFEVATAENGAAMDRVMAAAGKPFDLVVLDLMMPGEHGLEIARRLAGPGGPAMIILSAMGEEGDRIVGLELGADDYLPKPCSPRELLARIRAVLRRRNERGDAQAAEPGGLVAEFDGWRLDMVRHDLTSPDGVVIALSDGEFSLLRVFVERPQEPLAREELLELARGRESESYDRSIDVQISRLRRKLEGAAASGEGLIRTVRNEGYLFAPRVTRR